MDIFYVRDIRGSNYMILGVLHIGLLLQNCAPEESPDDHLRLPTEDQNRS